MAIPIVLFNYGKSLVESVITQNNQSKSLVESAITQNILYCFKCTMIEFSWLLRANAFDSSALLLTLYAFEETQWCVDPSWVLQVDTDV